MRNHFVRNNAEILAASSYVIQDPPALRGHYRERLGAPRLNLEIGTGKGRFLTDAARAVPSEGWIGVERIGSVLCKAAGALDRLIPAAALHNICLIRSEAEDLPDYLEPGEIDALYLNFSDPWPKAKHAKRRLTSARFLSLYERILVPGGILYLKTDSDILYSFSLEELPARGWTILASEDDYRPDAGDTSVQAIPTEYELQFRKEGRPIHMLRAQCPASAGQPEADHPAGSTPGRTNEEGAAAHA